MTDAGAIIAAAILGGTATLLSGIFAGFAAIERKRKNNRTTTTTQSPDASMIPGLAEICHRHAEAWSELRQIASAQQARQESMENLLTEVRSDVKAIYRHTQKWLGNGNLPP